MGRLKVSIRGHRRESFMRGRTRVRGSYVDPHIKMIPDVGRPGRTPKSRRVIPTLKRGGLGFGFKGRSQMDINRMALARARIHGEKRTGSRLHALYILNRRTNPIIARKAAIARTHVFKNIGDYKGGEFK